MKIVAYLLIVIFESIAMVSYLVTPCIITFSILILASLLTGAVIKEVSEL